MHKYISVTNDDKKEMLKTIGVDSIDDLFADIPEEFKLKEALNINESMSEIEVRNHIKKLANKNISTEELTCFLGAGTYDHYKPSIINALVSRSEFYTAYTPYQPEISQGTLKAIFEYQTMISELTGMYASNASVYDVHTAAAEAAIMAVAQMRKRETILVSETVHPETRQVLKTYLEHQGINIKEIGSVNGVTNVDEIEENMSKDVAAVIVQSPNFFGIIEDIEPIEKVTHSKKSVLIQSVDPMSLGILKNPGEYGVDIAVGDAQCFGNSMNFGGPHLGFIATNKKLVRKIPGRIVGQTEDAEGKRTFVLTLQAREQHIRRERAISNICSNQALNALMTTIYLSVIGKNGLKEIGMQCINKAHYAIEEITKSGKYSLAFDQPIFKEFAIKGEKSVDEINKNLLENKILGGYKLEKYYNDLSNTSLYAVTEKRTKEDIDKLVQQLEVI